MAITYYTLSTILFPNYPHNLFIPASTSFPFRPSPTPRVPAQITSSISNNTLSKSSSSSSSPVLTVTKRFLNLSIAISAVLFLDNPFSRNLFEALKIESFHLQRYADSKQDFTLPIPSSWNNKDPNKGSSKNVGVAVSKRVLLNHLSIFAAVVFLWNPLSRNLAKALTEAFQLQRYTDSDKGFTLLVPSSWNKVEKAGATVLFEDTNKGSINNVGVVVSPVKITKLSDFGSPRFVADKLIQAEKRKESTKNAEVVMVSERESENGVQVYEFEYKVDSSRGGMKRVFSAAFAHSKRLYLLNISHSDELDRPLEMDIRLALEKVLHSFDVAPST